MNSTELYKVNKDENETLNNSSSWKYEPPFDNIGIGVYAGLVIPMALFGVFANILNIVVIHRFPKSKSVFMLYIMSLSVSDFVSSFLSVVLLYIYTWGFLVFRIPTIFCKIGFAGDQVTSIVTSFHILLFCGLRLTAVAKPHAFRQIKLVHAKISIIVIWTIACLVGVFTFGWWVNVVDIDRRNDMILQNYPVCSFPYKWLSHLFRFSIYGYAFIFYFPLIGIAAISTAIGWILRRRQSLRIKDDKNKRNPSNEAEMNRQKKEKQAIRQLVLIVFAYFFGYIPVTMSVVIAPYLPSSEKKLQWWFVVFGFILMRISESLNPIFYNLGSSQLREETMKYLRMIFRCKHNQSDQSRDQEREKVRSCNAISTRVTEI